MANGRTLIVHGGGEHGHVVASVARLLDYSVKFTDDSRGTRPDPDDWCVVAIGDNAVRERRSRGLRNRATLRHPRSVCDASSCCGPGCFINAGAVLNAHAMLGEGVIVNTNAVIEHDCHVGAWCHVAPAAVLCGAVTLGEGVFVGANAVIKQGLTIAPWTVIGCGAVVVRDITEPGTYIGVPVARLDPCAT